MIWVFHGDNQPKLREAFLKLKSNYKEVRFWEQDLDALPAYLSAPTLFGGKELIVIENPNLGEIGERGELTERGEGKDIIFLFSQRLRQDALLKFKNARVTTFWEEAPTNIFPLLDAILAREKNKALLEAHRLLKEGTDLDFILKMIGWQLRNLAKVAGGAGDSLAPYLRKKVGSFARNWSVKDLKKAFALLLESDLKLKRGKKTPLDFLINKLTQSS